MRFGVCCSADRFAALKSAGYDYAEMNLSALDAMAKPEFEACAEASAQSSLPVEAVNCFFGDFRLTGPGADSLERIAAYADRALGKAAVLGVKTAVLGSGRQRSVPEGADRAEAEERFVEILRICGDAAGGRGITLALEPLHKAETNLITTVAEGHEFCRRANHPQVNLLADFYHMLMENEPVDNIPQAARYIRHIHLSRPDADRRCPTGADIEAGRPWPEALKRAGYNGRISLECAFTDFDSDIRAAWDFLQIFNS